MEENTTQSTPMGRVWMMVLLSALFVFGVSWFWHLSEMRTTQKRSAKESAKIQTSIAHLSEYRDVLREKGRGEAKVRIEQLRKAPYGI